MYNSTSSSDFTFYQNVKLHSNVSSATSSDNCQLFYSCKSIYPFYTCSGDKDGLMVEQKKLEKDNTTTPDADKHKRSRMLYPRKTLLDVLRVAESIKSNNNQRPYNRLDLAGSLNYSPNSSSFRFLITYSSAYGLTTGSYSAEKIALTPLGVSIVSPKSESEKAESMKTALFKIPFFQKFFTNFNQGIVPKKEFLLNTLNREYGITTDECEACYEITMKNARELGILVNIKGNDYIQLEKLSTDTVVENFEEPGETDEERTDEQSPTKDLSQLFKTEKQGPQTIEKQKPRVFISHSRNKKIVQQIETILKFGQFDYENAEERETIAIPISEKVFGLMKDCNCAIINLSVDEQEESDGGYKLNSNVLIEIGAAFLQYDRRVILLVDKRLSAQLPSNLNGLYRCEYQGDELSFDTAMKLQEALTKFREKKQK